MQLVLGLRHETVEEGEVAQTLPHARNSVAVDGIEALVELDHAQHPVLSGLSIVS